MLGKRTDVQKKNTSVGKLLDISLETHAGTGYTWALSKLPPCIMLIDKEDEANSDNSLVGGRVTQHFIFKATKPGKGYLEFDLLPPGKVDPDKKQKYLVIVTKDL